MSICMRWRRLCSISVKLFFALSLTLGGLIPVSYSAIPDMGLGAAESAHAVAIDSQSGTDMGDGMTCCHDHDGSCVNCVSILPGEVVAIATRRIETFQRTTDSSPQILCTLHYKPPRSLQI